MSCIVKVSHIHQSPRVGHKKAYSWTIPQVFGSEYLMAYLRNLHFGKVPQVINIPSEVGDLLVLKNAETLLLYSLLYAQY